MKKRLLSLILICTLTTVCLSGCKGQNTDETLDTAPSNGEAAGDATLSSDNPELEQAIEAYKAYSLPDTVTTYRLAYIDEDDIPECFFGGEKGINGWLSYRDGKVVECMTKNYADRILYDEKSHYVCFYNAVRNKNLVTDTFDYFKFENDGTFENIGYASYRSGEKVETRFDTYPRRDTTEEIYNEYKSQFGDLAMGFGAYEDMYPSIEDAYVAFLTQ